MTIRQTFELAVQNHRAGRLREAEQIYRRILAEQPRNAAVHYNLANALRDQGQLEQAIASFRAAIQFKPDFAEAHDNLACVLKDQGQLDQAIAAYRRAIQLKPHYAGVHYNLGNALRDQGQMDQAITSYRMAIQLKPDYAEAYYNLGEILREQGQLDQAITAYQTAIQLKGDNAEVHDRLGTALSDQGQLDQAIAAYRTAIQLKPDYAEAYYNLGNTLNRNGQLDQAIDAYRMAIQLKGDYAEAHNNLGTVLSDQGQLDQAIAAYRRAIQLEPDHPEVHNNLGNALSDQGELDQAIAAFNTAIQLKADYAEAHNNLANAFKDQGHLDQAMDAYRTSIGLKPDNAQAHSNLILSLHYHPGYDASAICEEERRWNQRHAEPLKKFIHAHANDLSPDRRLRVGYVSPDFREHPVGRFMLPVLEHHDHAALEIFCYADVRRGDALTEQLRRHADHWRKIVGLTDEQVAETVRQDRIDILVDLTMHAAGSRLLVFARKPAPVQVTWLSYPGSTGMQTIDYRLSDPQLDPPGLNDGWYSEKTLHLPRTYWCYRLAIDAPEVNALPALLSGRVTFGCLNNFAKVNEMMLSAWRRLLQELPNARLLLHAKEGSHRQKVRDKLAHEGIDPARLEFIGRVPVMEYFQCYQRIDIALDTSPFCGGTTTCDALWMGVPVASLVGKTTVSRGGLTILTNVGLPELAAGSIEDYVKIAAELAGDLPRLAALRVRLRQRMAQSPLMDAPLFAQNMETAYRDMWRRWCEAQER